MAHPGMRSRTLDMSACALKSKASVDIIHDEHCTPPLMKEITVTQMPPHYLRGVSSIMPTAR